MIQVGMYFVCGGGSLFSFSVGIQSAAYTSAPSDGPTPTRSVATEGFLALLPLGSSGKGGFNIF